MHIGIMTQCHNKDVTRHSILLSPKPLTFEWVVCMYRDPIKSLTLVKILKFGNGQATYSL
jgi:hypothetical protein